MGFDEPEGVVHWIDHHVVGTNDMAAWSDWAVNATGLLRRPIGGLTTAARKRNAPIMCFLWWEGGSCRIGAFLQPEVFPPSGGLGRDLPRCAFYIRPEDIDAHVRRLDRHRIPHTDPVRTAAEGEEGVAVYFEDPDGNQYEFWAPDIMPPGAMEIATPEKVGRISHVVFGSRDLSRTAAFFERYCGLRPSRGAAIAEGTLVLRLQAGARLVYRLVDRVDERVAGHGPWWDMHTALTVREEDYMPNYRRMWEGLPEEEDAKEALRQSIEEQDALPARTGLHRSPVGYRWKQIYRRGDEFYDWDGHAFHFYGGIPLTKDGSLALYRGKEQEEYLEELAGFVKEQDRP
ncbi:MAG TPA: VOC family protein [candidate division Zixibacteria bacterium]|nr:VOC family protein [candidate division Zixibacteria bacterium]